MSAGFFDRAAAHATAQAFRARKAQVDAARLSASRRVLAQALGDFLDYCLQSNNHPVATSRDERGVLAFGHTGGDRGDAGRFDVGGDDVGHQQQLNRVDVIAQLIDAILLFHSGAPVVDSDSVASSLLASSPIEGGAK